MTAPKPFTELHPIEASSIPRPGTEEYQKHLDELIAAATEIIDLTPQWKSRGKHHNGLVEIRERVDWRGKRNWFLRRSVHKDISFETFKRGLLENHSVNEKGYIEAIKETKLVEAIEPGVVEIWLNSYHIPMFSDRDFLTAIYTPPAKPTSFLIFCRPVLHPDAPHQPHHTRGMYESIEYVRDLGADGVEWIMTTASSPEGGIPCWVSERAMPGQISADVPSFLKWIATKEWK